MNKPARYQWIIVVWVGLALLALLGSSQLAFAEGGSRGQSLEDGPSLILHAEYIEGGSGLQVLAPRDLLRSAVQTATISVNYIGNWTPEAQAAFEYAVQIWESNISSPVPIDVDASWENLNFISPNVLGGASAASFRRNFNGAPVSNTWYPVALANRLYGSDLEPDSADIEASFNSAFSSWYFGTDANTPYNRYDFASVALHEIGHGLGFSGSMNVSGSIGGWGVNSSSPFIYDRFAVNGSGQTLIESFDNNSPELGAQLTSGDLYFSGSHAVAANGGVQPKLYAPASWEQGSSYSHLDENTYSAENGNALMTPALSNGEAIHFPGPITIGIFEDLGWGTTALPLTSTPTATGKPKNPETPTKTIAPTSTASVTITPTPAFKYFGYIPSIFKSNPIGQP